MQGEMGRGERKGGKGQGGRAAIGSGMDGDGRLGGEVGRWVGERESLVWQWQWQWQSAEDHPRFEYCIQI